MISEIMNALEKELPSFVFQNLKTKTIHLAIFKEPTLSFLLNGQKTIESRFSKNKILPYEQIGKDDIVLIKKSSGKVLGYFTINEVLFFDLTKVSIENIKKKYQKYLCVDEEFWNSKKNSRYASIIMIDELKLFAQPFSIHKKGMQTWLTFHL